MSLSSIFQDIANSIRSKMGTTDRYYPNAMASAINNIPEAHIDGLVVTGRFNTNINTSNGSMTRVGVYRGTPMEDVVRHLYFDDISDVVNLPTTAYTSNGSNMFNKANAFLNNCVDSWIVFDNRLVFNMSNCFVNSTMNSYVAMPYQVNNCCNMFADCPRYNKDTYIPYQATNLAYMFYNTSSFNANVITSPTALVESIMGSSYKWDIGHMFQGSAYNRDFVYKNYYSSIAGGPFYGTYNFNAKVKFEDDVIVGSNVFERAYGFNTSVVFSSSMTNFSNMFAYANSFNQPVGFLYLTSSNIDLTQMFYYSIAFNQNIVLPANTVSCAGMLSYATNFNKQVRFYLVNTQNTLNLYYMFMGATNFNSGILGIDTINVSTTYGMLYRTAFNRNLTLNSDKLTTCARMLAYSQMGGTSVVNLNSCSNLTNMANMLESTNYNENLWIPPNVKYTQGLLKDCLLFNKYVQDIASESKLSNIASMFENCVSVYSPLMYAHVGIFNNVVDASNAFNNCVSMYGTVSSTPNLIRGTGMFRNCRSLTVVHNEMTKVEYAQNMYAGAAIAYLPVMLNLINGYAMCDNSTSLRESWTSDGDINFSDSLNDASLMFKNCISLDCDVYIKKTANDINMSGMFRNCKSFASHIYYYGTAPTAANVVGMLADCNNSVWKYLHIKSACTTRFKAASATTSIVAAVVTWATNTNGFSNDVYKIRVYNNLT